MPRSQRHASSSAAAGFVRTTSDAHARLLSGAGSSMSYVITARRTWHQLRLARSPSCSALHRDEASGDEASAVWVPLPRDFLDVLQRHGAKLSELGASHKDDAMEREEEREADAPSTAAHVAGDPRQNLLAALELLPSCARRWSSRLAVSERVAAVRWMLRLTLDLHAAAAFVHLQEAIAAIIDGASDADWSGELLPSLIGALRTLLEPLPHTAVVRAVEFLRLPCVQQRCSGGAAAAIRLLVRRRARQAKAERARDRAEKRRMRTERQEQRKRQKVEAFASGGAVDADDDDEEEEDDDDEHEEEEEEESTGGDGDEDTDEIGIDNAAGALKHALETLDANLVWSHGCATFHPRPHQCLPLCRAQQDAPRRHRSQGDQVASERNQEQGTAQPWSGRLSWSGVESSLRVTLPTSSSTSSSRTTACLRPERADTLEKRTRAEPIT